MSARDDDWAEYVDELPDSTIESLWRIEQMANGKSPYENPLAPARGVMWALAIMVTVYAIAATIVVGILAVYR